MFSVIEDVFERSVDAIVMSPDPSKLCPAMFLAVAKAVAVAALPVVDPELPETLPVTLPVKFPVTLVVVSTPVLGL